MSGGSHGYVHIRMLDGDFIDQEGDLEYLADALKKYLAMPIELTNPAWSRESHNTPYLVAPSKKQLKKILRRGDVAIQTHRRMMDLIKEVKRIAASLAPLAQVLDRADSGDDGPSDVHDALLEWTGGEARR